ncbi:MAG: PAS domain S-box protein [Candidatus Cloacimonadota bacterium]|nr:PAS domain S-box protein [Candidatus Cloacimonadota bacterium]
MEKFRKTMEELVVENKQLKQVQQQYKALMEVLPEMTFTINQKGDFVNFSTPSDEILPFPGNEIIGKNIREMGLSTNDEKNVISAIEKTLQTDIIHKVQYVLNTLAGNGIFEGNIIKLDKEHVMVVVSDTTEKKSFRKKMNDREKKYIEIGDNFPGLFYQFIKKNDGSYFMPFICEDLNSLYSIPAKVSYNEKNKILDLIHKDDISYVKKSINRSAETMQKWMQEFRVVLENEEVRSILGISAPKEKGNGDMIWNGILVDITEEKKVGHNLFRTQEELKLTFDNSPIGVCTSDLEGKIISCNKAYCKMMGYKNNELQSKTFFQFTHENYKKLNHQFFDQLVNGNKPYYEFYKKNIRKNGKFLDVFIRAKLVKDEIGKPLFVISVIEDITKLKIAEAKALLNEAQFRKLATSNPTGIMIFQNDKWQYANPTAEKICGYSLSELKNMNFWDFVHPDFVKIVREQGTRRQNGKLAKYHHELKIVTKKGNPKWVELFGTNIIYNKKNAGLVSILDVSEKKSNEKIQEVLLNISEVALKCKNINQLSESIYKELSSVIPTNCFYIALYNPKTDMYNFPYHNDPFEKINPEEEISLKFSLTDYVRTTGKARLITLQEDERLRQENEIKLIGKAAPVWMGAPIVDSTSNNAIGVIAVQDYTNENAFTNSDLKILEIISRNIGIVLQQKKAEDDLKKSEAKFRTLFEESIDTVYRTSVSGKFLQINRAGLDLFGYSLEEIQNINVSDIYSNPKERMLFQKSISRDGYVQEFELILKKKDGLEFPAIVSARTIESNSGEILGYQGIIHDITEHKKADAILEKAAEEKELLLQEAHHRIKNNFTIISSILNMQSHNIRDEKDKEMFRDSQNRVMLMANLHESLYKSADISKVDMKLYLGQIIDRLCEGYEIDKSGIEVTINIEQIQIPSKTATHCGLLLSELFTNAFKYGFPENKTGKIEISFVKFGDEDIVLKIFNDGVPLSPNFDLKKSESLGLQLVDMLVQQLEGKIEISRENGTEFKITFNYKNL